MQLCPQPYMWRQVGGSFPGSVCWISTRVQGYPLYNAEGEAPVKQHGHLTSRWYPSRTPVFWWCWICRMIGGERVTAALKQPVWPIYLGRKELCPIPTVFEGVQRHSDLLDAIQRYPVCMRKGDKLLRRRCTMNVRFQETGGEFYRPDVALGTSLTGTVYRGVITRKDKMYLTKIDLIPQQRGIRQALGDGQQLHQMIMGLFESDGKLGRNLSGP